MTLGNADDGRSSAAARRAAARRCGVSMQPTPKVMRADRTRMYWMQCRCHEWAVREPRLDQPLSDYLPTGLQRLGLHLG